MNKNILKLLIISLSIVPMQYAEAKKKRCLKLDTLKVCSLIAQNVAVNGTLTLNGIPLNNLIALAEAIGASGATPGTAAAANLAAALAAISAGGSGSVGGLLGYGYIYNVGAQTVANESPVNFDTNGPLLGITHTPSSPAINIVSAGTYAITFSVSSNDPNQFAIFVNGAASASTVYGSGAGTQQNTGHAILTLGAGDTLTLVNHTTGSGVILQTSAGGTATNVNASVLIERLSA